MPFTDIEPRLNFSDNWNPDARQTVTDEIQIAYENSDTFRSIVDTWLSPPGNVPLPPTIDIYFVPDTFAATAGGGEIAIDPAYHLPSLFIDNTGTARSYSLIAGIVHELVHALTGALDDVTLGRADFPGYRGRTVILTNAIMQEVVASRPDTEHYDRNSYIAFDIEGSVLEEGFEYTNGVAIDRSLVLEDDFSGVRDWDSSPTGNSDDLLIGDRFDNVLTSGNGDDFLYGNEGDDTLSGGRGQDFLSGGSNGTTEDRLSGGTGHDILVGGSGQDILNGDSGRDLLIASEFVDRFIDTSIDFLNGGNGDDVLVGGNGGALMRGGQGNDLMIGGSNDDIFEGGSQADYIYTGGGADEVRGGAGNDWINATAPGSAATVYVSADSGRDYIQQAADGSGYTGVSEIVFEGISSGDVELIWNYDITDWELVFVNYEDRIDDENEPLPIASYIGEISGTATIRIAGTGASINIGAVSGSIGRTDYHAGTELTSALDAQTFNIFAELESDLLLTFDDLQFGRNSPSGSAGVIDRFESLRLSDETIELEEFGLVAWDDVINTASSRYESAPNNFANGFFNPYVRDDVNLLDPVTDYGLIGTTDAFGLLI